MKGYTTADVARLLGLDPRRIRRLARGGIVQPVRGPRNEYRFDFQDLVLLRAAAGLLRARVPGRRILSALRSLRRQLPDGSLSGLRISADADTIVVRDASGAWHPLSGQLLLDFRTDHLAGTVEPIRPETERPRQKRDAQAWYELGVELEAVSRDEARRAYERALDVEPSHADALVNLGRIIHEDGDPASAASLYRRALAGGRHATAAFNLGVALEDLGRDRDAIDAYHAALSADERFADAHFNLSRIHERLGDSLAALRHLRSYRSLTGGSRTAH